MHWVYNYLSVLEYGEMESADCICFCGYPGGVREMHGYDDLPSTSADCGHLSEISSSVLRCIVWKEECG